MAFVRSSSSRNTPEQNGVAESFMGTLKLECVWQTRFDTYEQAKAAITAWVKSCNETRPHSRPGYLPPAEWRRRQVEISV
jgi:transposase InsO family protein